MTSGLLGRTTSTNLQKVVIPKLPRKQKVRCLGIFIKISLLCIASWQVTLTRSSKTPQIGVKPLLDCSYGGTKGEKIECWLLHGHEAPRELLQKSPIPTHIYASYDG